MNKNLPRCCVITPVGPGHESLYDECKASVEAAFKKSKGPFSEIIFAPMLDADGAYGRSQRRNDGIRFSKEQKIEWIFFLDADDLMVETAFESFAPYEKKYDAVWGAIYEAHPGASSELRPQQVMPIKSLGPILKNDPYLTLQMGHFVRTDIALKELFDEELDTGEDFKYYLNIWRDNKCIKIDMPFFVNRRGIHSTGPRSADGEMWRKAVSDVFVKFRIANRKKIARYLKDRANALKKGRHIVVTGFSRSGTTMFYNMLRSSVVGFGMPDKEMPASALISQKRRSYITKRPLDIFSIDEILKANSFNKPVDIIILIRDIRSVITSLHRSVPDDYFIGYDYQYFLPSTGEPQFVNPGVLAITQAIGQLMKSNIPCRKIILRYEDIVASPAVTQEYLAMALGLDYKAPFERFNESDIPAELDVALNAKAAPDKSRITKWKQPEHRERIKTQFTECPQLFDILRDFGYEKDDSWFDEYRAL